CFTDSFSDARSTYNAPTDNARRASRPRRQGENDMQHVSKLGFAVAFALAAPAFAHHGIASFDMNREFVIEGTITDVDWVNPHSWLYLDAVTADGKVVKYR